MVYLEISLDIQAFCFLFFFCITGGFKQVEYKRNTKQLWEYPPLFLKKSDITELSCNYKNFCSSTPVKIPIEKEQLKKGIFEIKIMFYVLTHK